VCRQLPALREQPPADADALNTGLVDEINGDATVSQIVTASVVTIDGDDYVEIVGVVDDSHDGNFWVDWRIVGGTGAMTCEAEASEGSVRLYATLGGSPKTASDTVPEGAWIHPPGTEYDFTYRGFLERFEVAGLDRAALEVFDLAGEANDGSSYSGAISYVVEAVYLAPSVLAE